MMEKIKEIREKLSVYEFYADDTNIYWEYLGHIYYLPKERYYELKEYFSKYFSRIEDEERRRELILENLSISAYILEENQPKITVYNIKGHPVYKIEGEMEDEMFIERTHSPFPYVRKEEKQEKNPFLKKVLEYTKNMVKRLRRGQVP